MGETYSGAKALTPNPLPTQVGAAIGLAFGVTLLPELVALLIRHDHQSYTDTHGRENEDQDTALQRLDHPRTSPGGLGVAKSATLAPCGQRKAHEQCEQKRSSFPAGPNFCVCHSPLARYSSINSAISAGAYEAT